MPGIEAVSELVKAVAGGASRTESDLHVPVMPAIDLPGVASTKETVNFNSETRDAGSAHRPQCREVARCPTP